MIQPDMEKSTAQLIDRAIDIEKRAARLYGEFAKLFPKPPELVDFWQDLVKDEGGHLKLLMDLKSQLNDKQLAAPANLKIWNNITDAERLLSNNPASNIYTLDDAYELTHELEFSEVNAVFLFLVQEYGIDKKQLDFARDEIVQHQSKLINFSRTFGDRLWRKGIFPSQ